MPAEPWNAAAAAALAGEISPTRLMADLDAIARRVRLSGTAEELESFRTVEAAMRRAGFATSLITHPAYISLPGRSELRIDGAAVRSITHSMAVPTPPAGLAAPVAYVGKGRAADFAAPGLAGRIALVDGIAWEDVAAWASAAGVAGLIHVCPTEQLHEMCVSPVWGSPSQHTRAGLPAVAICSVAATDGAAIRARCLAGEAVEAFMATEVDTGWRPIPLLVAELAAPGEPFVLLSGHIDSWHYGAMDNASANAAMIEAARLLATRRDAWRRGLRVCFWSGHSHGRYAGSAWYADQVFEELDRRCVAHVNVDSLGGAGATELGRSAVIDELKAVAAEAVAAVTGQVHAGNRHFRVADQSFWGIGLPSMFGSLSYQPRAPGDPVPRLGWWWHTPEDLVEHIDPDHLVRDTAIVLRVLHRLLTSPVLPLDYAATAASLAAGLDALDRGRIDLGPVRAALAIFTRLAAAVPTADAPPDALNRALMRVSRALVPLNYTTGDRFNPDPALDQSPWPALVGLRELAALSPDSPDMPFHRVDARRALNRLAHALSQANQALGAVLANPSQEAPPC